MVWEGKGLSASQFCEKPISLINKNTLGEELAGVIRLRIIDGFYNFGDRLVGDKLAQEFEISRVSVQDALKILEAEGLVVRERNQTAKVFEVDEKKIKDIYDIRIAIETFSIDLLINENDSLIKDFETGFEQIVQAEAKNTDELKLYEYDLAFHEMIIEMGGNTYAIDIWRTIRNQLKALYSRIHKKNIGWYSGVAHEQHSGILSAVKNRDYQTATKLIKEHIKDNIGLLNRLDLSDIHQLHLEGGI